MSIVQPTISFQALITSSALNTAFGTFTSEINRVANAVDAATIVGTASQLVKLDSNGYTNIKAIALSPAVGQAGVFINAPNGYTNQGFLFAINGSTYISFNSDGSATFGNGGTAATTAKLRPDGTSSFGGAATFLSTLTASGVVTAPTFVGALTGNASTSSAPSAPVETHWLSELRVTATGSSMIMTIQPGPYPDANGTVRYYFGGGTVTAISDPAQQRWFLIGMTTGNVPIILHSAPGSGPETITTTGYTIIASGVIPAAATAIYQHYSGTPAGQGYLAGRVFGGGGGGGGGGGTYTDANVATVLGGTTAQGSALSLISGGSLQGKLSELLTANIGFDPRARFSVAGATIYLAAGTGTTGNNAPAVFSVGGNLYKVTANISVTASGASGIRYVALDWTAANGAFVLTLLLLNQSPSSTQFIIGQCYYDATVNAGVGTIYGLNFDNTLTVASRQVALETYRTVYVNPLTQPTQLSGAGKIMPTLIASPINFWLGASAMGRVQMHARGYCTYASAGVGTISSGVLLTANIRNGPSYGVQQGGAVDVAYGMANIVGQFTLDPWEDYAFQYGWNNVTPMAIVTDNSVPNACTITWYDCRASVQLYNGGLFN